jgi:hypothetical protein
MTDTQASHAASRSFALGEAQRQIATQAFQFVLASSESKTLELHVDIAPLGVVSKDGKSVASYRRSVKTVKSGKASGENSSINRVDLSTRCFVGLDVEGLATQISQSKPLPAVAKIGDAGPYFENVAKVKANPQGATHRSVMTWSLEPWENGCALWCTGVQAPGGGGVENAECYVITEAGDVVGAALRAWALAPAPNQPGASAGTGKPPTMIKRMVELRTK